MPDDILDQCDYVLSQPLVTDEGFINPACMNELESVLSNMPPFWDRLARDPKWNTLMIVQASQIAGYFSCWSVRNLNSTYVPPNLGRVVGYVGACVRSSFAALDSTSFWHREGWANKSMCDVGRLLNGILVDCVDFQAWNTPAYLGDDWLDLEAIIRNVCLSCWNEHLAFERDT